MILPTAIVDRWPADKYCGQHDNIESACKHSVADLLRLHHEIQILKYTEQSFGALDIPEQYLSKDLKSYLKRNEITTVPKKFIDHIIQLTEQYESCLKGSDYPAMVMASYPQARFVSRDRFRYETGSICENPVLLRGISSGKIADQVRALGQDYYFIETGYLGNYPCANNRTGRKIYHRIVKNAMQHSTIMDVPDDRWQQLVKFNPDLEYQGWRRSGSKILVVLSTEKPFHYYKENKDTWIKQVIKTLKKHTDREIVFREKASRGERTNNTIYDALDDDIYALVTYQSVAAIEAIQAGIPVFALAPTAADPVGNKDLTQIENPHMPDETVIQKWLHSIAYSQFSLDEIITGEAWQMVLENEQRPTFTY
jgi:hypothetical protein